MQAPSSQMTTISKDLAWALPAPLTSDAKASTAQLDYQNQLSKKDTTDRMQDFQMQPRSPSSLQIHRVVELSVVSSFSGSDGGGDIVYAKQASGSDPDDLLRGPQSRDRHTNSALWDCYSYLSNLIDSVSRLGGGAAILRLLAGTGAREPADVNLGLSKGETPKNRCLRELANLSGSWFQRKPLASTDQCAPEQAPTDSHQGIALSDTLTLAAQYINLDFWPDELFHSVLVYGV